MQQRPLVARAVAGGGVAVAAVVAAVWRRRWHWPRSELRLLVLQPPLVRDLAKHI